MLRATGHARMVSADDCYLIFDYLKSLNYYRHDELIRFHDRPRQIKVSVSINIGLYRS